MKNISAICLEYTIKKENIYTLDEGMTCFCLNKLIEMILNKNEKTTNFVVLSGEYCEMDMLLWDNSTIGGLFFINNIRKEYSPLIPKSELYLVEFDENDNLTQVQKFIRD